MTTTIVKAWLSVAGVALPSTATNRSSIIQSLFDLGRNKAEGDWVRCFRFCFIRHRTVFRVYRNGKQQADNTEDQLGHGVASSMGSAVWRSYGAQRGLQLANEV